MAHGVADECCEGVFNGSVLQNERAEIDKGERCISADDDEEENEDVFQVVGRFAKGGAQQRDGAVVAEKVKEIHFNAESGEAKHQYVEVVGAGEHCEVDGVVFQKKSELLKTVLIFNICCCYCLKNGLFC